MGGRAAPHPGPSAPRSASGLTRARRPSPRPPWGLADKGPRWAVGAQAAAAPAPEERGERKPRSSGRWCGFVRGRSADETGHFMPLPHSRPAKQGPFWFPAAAASRAPHPQSVSGVHCLPSRSHAVQVVPPPESPPTPTPPEMWIDLCVSSTFEAERIFWRRAVQPRISGLPPASVSPRGRLPALLLPVRGNQIFT